MEFYYDDQVIDFISLYDFASFKMHYNNIIIVVRNN